MPRFFTMNYSLPKTVSFGDETHEIRYDFRVILEIITMLSDHELDGEDKTEALLEMFYLDPESIRDIKGAVDACFDFIESKKRQKKSPRLMDWEQDFEYIIAPVNRVLGYEARAVEYDPIQNTGGVHWWTFLAAYLEIGGDCLYSQIVSIRDKQARKKKLEKYERDWLKRNGDIVRLKTNYTQVEDDLINEWTKGGG